MAGVVGGKEDVEEERFCVTLIPLETFTTFSVGFHSELKSARPG